MDSSQFGKFTSSAALTLNHYFKGPGPKMVVRETLRFIDNNFRKQGWQGASLQPWKPIKRPGLTLIKTGRLRRGFNSEIRGGGEVYFYNNVPYARAHNEGFKGQISVKPHLRNAYMKAKLSNVSTKKVKTEYTKTTETKVGGYTRNANIIQRQFAPITDNDSPMLIAAITKEIEQSIINILKF